MSSFTVSAVRHVASPVAGACTDEKDQGPKKTRITVALAVEPDTLLPMFTDVQPTHQVIEAGTPPLTRYNDRGELIPGVAKVIPTLDNGGVKYLDRNGKFTDDPKQAEKIRVFWYIRRDAKWSDGTPVTARDFVYAHRVMMEPGQPTVLRELEDRIEKMEVADSDPNTLIVTWKTPYAFYAQYRIHPALRSDQVDKLPAGQRADLSHSDLSRHPVFYGPFLLHQWVPGQYLHMVRNPYAFDPPEVDEVYWRIMPDANATIAALEAGEVDIIPPGGITLSKALEVQGRHPDRFQVISRKGLESYEMILNVEDEVLKDVRVRQAVYSAINREDLLAVLNEGIPPALVGSYTPAKGLFPEGHEGYTTDLPAWPYDTDKAAQLLDAAGWSLPAGGSYRVNQQGQELRLKLFFPTGQPQYEKMALVMQDRFKAVGIRLDLEAQIGKVLFGTTLKERRGQLILLGWGTDLTDYGETRLPCDQIPSAKNSWAGQNYSGYCDPKLDAVIRGIPRIVDPVQRQEALREINRGFSRDLPVLELVRRPTVALVRNGIENVRPTGNSTPITWNCQEWTIAKH